MTDKDGNQLLMLQESHAVMKYSTLVSIKVGMLQRFCVKIQVITVGCLQVILLIIQSRSWTRIRLREFNNKVMLKGKKIVF